MTYSPVKTTNGTKTCWFLEGPFDDSDTVRSLPIYVNPFQVGRRQDVALTLLSPNVSNLHAELAQQNHALILRDLGSTNGTFVNGNRVQDFAVLSNNDLVQFASVPFRVRARFDHQITQTMQDDSLARAVSLVNFDRLMNERAVTPYFQPIVRVRDGGIVGYEALGRSRLPLLGSPDEMFRIAKRLNLVVELSVMLRDEAVRVCHELRQCSLLFVNTHPQELTRPGLLESLRATRELYPAQPLVLEIHEHAVSDRYQMRALRSALTELNIGLAYDDFGAGQSRLNELVEIPPDFLKFDISLIRDIHRATPSRLRMLATLVQMVRDLGIAPLAEGVECKEENDACAELQFEVAQGYYYGRPAPVQSCPQ